MRIKIHLDPHAADRRAAIDQAGRLLAELRPVFGPENVRIEQVSFGTWQEIPASHREGPVAADQRLTKKDRQMIEHIIGRATCRAT